MSEHFTKNTLETRSFCRTCGRPTQHRVSCGRIAECLEHQAPAETKKQVSRREELERRDRQPELF